MNDYTPDLIHIHGGWRHFIPAAIGAGIVFMLAVLTWRRHQFFPRAPWLPSEFLFMAMVIAGPIFLFCVVLNVFSTHATDHMKNNADRAGLVAEAKTRTGLRMPEDAEVEAAVSIGNRRPARWFAIRADTSAILAQLSGSNFQERDSEAIRIQAPRPEPVETWLRQSEFKPLRAYTASEHGRHREVYIDPARGLTLVITSGR